MKNKRMILLIKLETLKMLNRNIFFAKMKEIAIKNDIDFTSKNEYLNALYEEIKEFSDNEFIEIVQKIIRNEELYNKMPSISKFYKYKNEDLKNYQPTLEQEASIQWEIANDIQEGKITELTNKILESMGDNYGSWKWRMNPEHPHHTPQNWMRKEFIERYTAVKTGEKILYIEREKERNNLLNNSEEEEEGIEREINYTKYSNKPVSLKECMDTLLKTKSN
jgi:hypothetical protein